MHFTPSADFNGIIDVLFNEQSTVSVKVKVNICMVRFGPLFSVFMESAFIVFAHRELKATRTRTTNKWTNKIAVTN